MSNLIFLAPDETTLARATQLFEDIHEDIQTVHIPLSEVPAKVSALAAQGTEIVITRGSAANAIKEAGIDVTVVEMSITGYDVIRSVEKAKRHGSTIAALSFPRFMGETAYLGPLLGVDLRIYPFDSEDQAEERMRQAFRDGSDVVIGGYIAKGVAEKHQYPFEIVESGPAAILQATEEAKRIIHARNLEKAKTTLFRAIIDYAYEGIIAVDDEQRVTSFNPVAERITGLNGQAVIGQPINKVWSGLQLKEVMRTGQDDLSQLVTINNVDILCNKVALNVNNQIVGAVITFQDVAVIQHMEAAVRQRVYSSGHVASFCFKDTENTSPDLAQTIEIAKNFALTRSSIVIIGETGTGKEVFAQSIHNYSQWHQGPFVAINCAALPEQILESELFGYVGGAFTGANPKGKPGLFELAHDGTIFLDEIAEMDYALQGKLLRVLQERKVMRLGSDRLIPVNVRVIASTNKNLKQLVADSKFRPDLYYRLNVLQLVIPPLRQRKNDIMTLASFFLHEQAGIAKRRLKLGPSALKVLTEYDWPGNVRELKNIMERIIAVHKQEIINESVVRMVLEDHEAKPTGLVFDEAAEIRKALALTRGKYAEAAKLLGMSRSTLWRKLKRLGLR
jgi:transcriptional regulator with PAS, ATPase and Fis domain